MLKHCRDGSRKGVNTLVYTEAEIERIAKVAFDVAGKRSKNVFSIDKANVLECTGLWREVVTKVHADYQDITLFAHVCGQLRDAAGAESEGSSMSLSPLICSGIS